MELKGLLVFCFFCLWQVVVVGSGNWEEKVVKGNRNALYLVRKGKRHMFPDFHTFTQMGFNTTSVNKIPDDELNRMPMGEMLPAIAIFRPEDYMYHHQCDDPDRMVNDLSVVANLGDLIRFANVYKRVQESKSIDVLLLGGSITAGGYFMEFFRLLRTELGLNVTFHNHGHGATEITYSIFCVGMERYIPDLVLIDFAVNDYGHPKLMDTLLRKALILPSLPLVTLVNLWVHSSCPPTRYLLHSYYYQLPVINVCPAVNLCFGKGHLPKYIWEQYSKTDGVHPWGPQGVPFLGKLLFAWWKKMAALISEDVSMDPDGKMHATTHSFDALLQKNNAQNHAQKHGDSLDGSAVVAPSYTLPPPLYALNPIGVCTKCMALADDADAKLWPVERPRGFRAVTRVKVGFGGFSNTGAATATSTEDTLSSQSQQQQLDLGKRPTKSSKKSWQADRVGAQITFPFYGSSVRIAIWQRRDGMGVLDAIVDQDRSRVVQASGFFKGYTWAMEKNNTGRSEIVPLFEGLREGFHNLTLTVSETPANKWVPGHLVQIFAVLSASDDAQCKDKVVSTVGNNQQLLT